jgi:sirohydrochlorin cobaltochelatase
MSTNDRPARGLVLLAHGARDPAWAVPFEAMAARAREGAPGTPVRLAFLELMAPGLEAAAGELAALGCRRIDVVPVFLGMGGHVRRDVPAQVEALRRAHPGVGFALHPAVGETPRVIAAIAEAALACVGRAPAPAAAGRLDPHADDPDVVHADDRRGDRSIAPAPAPAPDSGDPAR